MRVQGRVSAAPASSCMACCLAGWCDVTSGGDGGWESGNRWEDKLNINDDVL